MKKFRIFNSIGSYFQFLDIQMNQGVVNLREILIIISSNAVVRKRNIFFLSAMHERQSKLNIG